MDVVAREGDAGDSGRPELVWSANKNGFGFSVFGSGCNCLVERSFLL